MSVLKRPMFRRPSALPPLRGPMPVVRETYPVVKRNEGTPSEGEDYWGWNRFNWDADEKGKKDYEDKGYDAYEYEGDKAQESGWDADKGILKWLYDKIKNSKIVKNIDDHLREHDQWGKGNEYVLNEYEFGLLYPNIPFDSVTVEERTINTEGDDYRKLVELTTPSARATGSPIQGENSYYSQTINPEIIKEQDKMLDKQDYPFTMEMEYKKKQFARGAVENLKKISSGEFSTPTLILDSFEDANRYLGKEGALQVLRENNFDTTNSKVYRYLESLNEDFFNTFLYDDDGDFRGVSDDYYFERMPENMKKYVAPLMEIMSTDIVSREAGSPIQGEQVDVENVGIMDGFNQNPDQVAAEVLTQGKGAQEAIDSSETYDELMRAIRGDDLSEADRRQELASFVGEADAERTPDSVLVLVQPVMQMLDQETANTGIGQIESGALEMPQRPVGIATGGVVQKFNQGNLATRFENILPTYLGLEERFSNPNQGKADALMALSRAGFDFAKGGDWKDSASKFFDETYALGSKRADEENKMKMQLAMAALSQAGQQEIAAMKRLNEATKKKQTLAVGQNDDRDKFIAIKLGFVKNAPTGVKGNPMGVQGPEYSQVVDWERFYEFYPKGTELQFNWDFTEFLGKKGSAIRYEGKGEDYKDGGIVKRASGTSESGEETDIDQIFQYEGVGTSTEMDDINKLIARSNNTLNELYRMKEILVNNPEIGGFPGAVLETLQGLFTMVDQLDDAYLGDKLFDKKGKIFKTFNKKEIQEIQMLKNSIAQGIADLRSFKGTRQPTATQEQVSVKEIDPTGLFGGEVAKQKVDAVTEKVANLLKEYIKLTTVGEDDEMDKQSIADKFGDIDAFVQSILNLQPDQGTTGFKQKDSYSLDEIEEIIKLGDGDTSAVELSDTTIKED